MAAATWKLRELKPTDVDGDMYHSSSTNAMHFFRVPDVVLKQKTLAYQAVPNVAD